MRGRSVEVTDIRGFAIFKLLVVCLAITILPCLPSAVQHERAPRCYQYKRGSPDMTKCPTDDRPIQPFAFHVPSVPSSVLDRSRMHHPYGPFQQYSPPVGLTPDVTYSAGAHPYFTSCPLRFNGELHKPEAINGASLTARQVNSADRKLGMAGSHAKEPKRELRSPEKPEAEKYSDQSTEQPSVY